LNESALVAPDAHSSFVNDAAGSEVADSVLADDGLPSALSLPAESESLPQAAAAAPSSSAAVTAIAVRRARVGVLLVVRLTWTPLSDDGLLPP